MMVVQHDSRARVRPGQVVIVEKFSRDPTDVDELFPPHAVHRQLVCTIRGERAANSRTELPTRRANEQQRRSRVR